MQVLTNVNLNKNELQNMVLQNLAVAPANPNEGQMYYNTVDKQAYQYKGAEKGWEAVGAPYDLPIASADTLGGVKVGAGLAVNKETGVLSATGGGVADAVDWANVTSKPFDRINSGEMQVTGGVGNKELGIKAVSQDKVTGLKTALEGKISGVKKNGVNVPATKGVVDISVPTKVSDLTNDSKFISSAEAPVQSVNGDTGVVSVTPASIGAVPTERTVNSKPLTSNITLNATDVGALPKNGGTMGGSINMDNNKITNLPVGSAEGDAVNKKQLDEAIAGIGTVFDLKGYKPTYSALPKVDNKIGDVWFVEDESVGYIWLNKDGVLQWEKFGESIDLSGFLTKEGLLQGTGPDTKNAMSQDAVTKALNEKANASTVNAIPIVKTKSDNITSSKTTVAIAYTGTFLSAYAKTNTGEQVITDVKIEASKVTFTVATAPNSSIACTIVYM